MDNIYQKLLEMGIPVHLNGFGYLHSAIEMVQSKGNTHNQLITKLYPALAKKHNSPWRSMESSMCRAIEIASNSKNKEFSRYFGTKENSRPPVGRFIKTVAFICTEDKT